MSKGTEIGEVRGLGSAHHGAGHWVLMQATSAGALITCAYLVISFLLLPDLTFPTLTGWLKGLGPSFALALLIVTVAPFFKATSSNDHLVIVCGDGAPFGRSASACQVPMTRPICSVEAASALSSRPWSSFRLFPCCMASCWIECTIWTSRSLG